jgi:AMP-binding enzyme
MFSRDLIQPVQTLCELLDLIQAQPDQDRTAISFYRGAERGASLTHGEYLAAIHSWSVYLQGAGVVPGDRVATLMRNRIEVPIIYLAVMSIGAIAVPLNPSYSVDEMAYVLDDASPVLVVTDRATGGERLEELRRAGGCLVLEDLRLPTGKAPRRVGVSGDDPAIILYTSGTTVAGPSMMPVSSKVSRAAAWQTLSPCSRCPDGEARGFRDSPTSIGGNPRHGASAGLVCGSSSCCQRWPVVSRCRTAQRVAWGGVAAGSSFARPVPGLAALEQAGGASECFRPGAAPVAGTCAARQSGNSRWPAGAGGRGAGPLSG